MLWALPLFWAACFAAGYFYTQPRGVPLETVIAVAPAFLLEATLFLYLGIEHWRKRLDKLKKPSVAGLLVLGAVTPYALAALATGSFQWTAFFGVAGLAAVISGWYLVLPAHPASDIGLILVAVAVVLLKPFEIFYIRPHPGLALEALGQAMWFRTGLLAMLSIRRIKGVGFGFWPSRREWGIGATHFAMFLPLAVTVGWWIGFTRPRAPEDGLLETAGLILLTFFGTLWVLALGEEFLFRGLIQQWLTDWLRSPWGALLLTSVLFGCAHLWTPEFPNWRFALLAGLAGMFYGSAFRRGRGIRAAMVVHALTVTTWKTFFT